jgi:hypothetical protein
MGYAGVVWPWTSQYSALMAKEFQTPGVIIIIIIIIIIIYLFSYLINNYITVIRKNEWHGQSVLFI